MRALEAKDLLGKTIQEVNTNAVNVVRWKLKRKWQFLRHTATYTDFSCQRKVNIMTRLVSGERGTRLVDAAKKVIKVGDMVLYRHVLNSQSGTVISDKVVGSDNLVIVEWSNGLITKSEIDLLTVKSDLESSWQAIQDQLLIASQAIIAAEQIVRKEAKCNLREAVRLFPKLDIMGTVFDALDCSGWQTSSMTSDC